VLLNKEQMVQSDLARTEMVNASIYMHNPKRKQKVIKKIYQLYSKLILINLKPPDQDLIIKKNYTPPPQKKSLFPVNTTYYKSTSTPFFLKTSAKYKT
jgi:hypothetical protein